MKLSPIKPMPPEGPTVPADPQFADPSAAAAADWIRSQQKSLWRYLRLLGARLDEAEDLLQEAFLRVLRDYANRSPRAQAALLRTVARNAFLDLRRARREAIAWSDAVDAWLAECPSELDDSSSEQLAACLQELSERARLGLRLHHIDGGSIGEVASRLGLGRNGARSLLQRSRAALRSCLARRGVGPTSTHYANDGANTR